MITITEVEERARKRYASDCRRHNAIYQEPGSFTITGDIITLRNVRGILAQFRIHRNILGKTSRYRMRDFTD